MISLEGSIQKKEIKINCFHRLEIVPLQYIERMYDQNDIAIFIYLARMGMFDTRCLLLQNGNNNLSHW